MIYNERWFKYMIGFDDFNFWGFVNCDLRFIVSFRFYFFGFFSIIRFIDVNFSWVNFF